MSHALATSLDVAFARSRFPALADETAYFDNAGGSQTLREVVDRIADYLLTTNVQLGATYATSVRATERLQDAQHRMAELVNAARPDEIVMGPTSTLLVQLLAKAMMPQLVPGDEVVVTRADHESNIGAWVQLASMGVVPRFWEMSWK